MRASLIAPALTMWLISGIAACVLLNAPWYVGAGVGFLVAAVTYWLWPKLTTIPVWLLHVATAGVAATTFLMGAPTFLMWIAGFSIALELLMAARTFSRRHEPQVESFD